MLDIERLKELEAKATPAPWECGEHPANPAMSIIRPIMFGNRVGKLPEWEGGHAFFRSAANAELIAECRNALPALLVRVAELEAAHVAVNTWGVQLFDGLGKFLQAASEAAGPLTTKLMCSFPDRPDHPVLHLWATTDGQSPIARNSELRTQLTERDRQIEELEAGIRTARPFVAQGKRDPWTPASQRSASRWLEQFAALASPAAGAGDK